MTTQPQAIPAAPAGVKLRIGSVAYLNSKPLNVALDGDIALATPAELARGMETDELDVALLPVMAVLEHPEYALADGFGIACRGPVHSVILSSARPLSEITTIAADDASRSSNALLRVLVHDFLNRPDIRFVEPDQPGDAHLWIGDRAIARRREHPEERHLDLGTAWWQWQRKPFVFAVWALKGAAKNPDVAEALRAASRAGLQRRASLAQTPEEYDYLTKRIRYEIGAEEKAGLEAFAQALHHRGLLENVPQLEWI
ncbi:MAG: menaquinone biosynthesis protein [Verrucomicrobiota bacterium]